MNDLTTIEKDLKAMEATGITKLRDQTLLEKRNELTEIIKEAKELLDSVNEEFKERIEKKGKDNRLDIAERHVLLVERPVWSGVTLGTARQLKAVKEALDTTALGHLYKAGRKIKGIEFSEYVTVK